jgi:hypothetical protein
MLVLYLIWELGQWGVSCQHQGFVHFRGFPLHTWGCCWPQQALQPVGWAGSQLLQSLSHLQGWQMSKCRGILGEWESGRSKQSTEICTRLGEPRETGILPNSALSDPIINDSVGGRTLGKLSYLLEVSSEISVLPSTKPPAVGRQFWRPSNLAQVRTLSFYNYPQVLDSLFITEGRATDHNPLHSQGPWCLNFSAGPCLSHLHYCFSWLSLTQMLARCPPGFLAWGYSLFSGAYSSSIL